MCKGCIHWLWSAAKEVGHKKGPEGGGAGGGAIGTYPSPSTCSFQAFPGHVYHAVNLHRMNGMEQHSPWPTPFPHLRSFQALSARRVNCVADPYS